MNTLATGLQALGNMISSAESVTQAFQQLRESFSEEQWEELTNGGPLVDLLDACSDLEYDLTQQ